MPISGIRVTRPHLLAAAFLLLASFAPAQTPAPAVPAAMEQLFARDPKQPIDQSYTAAIAKDTTEPYFNSPLTNYLPASKTVPTPAAVLGDIAGAPGKLPYAEDISKYFRLLEAHTPRVKVFSIGKSEEGREMIAAAVGDEALLKQLDANSARLAQLADPRPADGKPAITDQQAAALARQSFPVYYITGTIHSTENRRANRADGTRVSAGGRRFTLYPVYPRAHGRAHHARGRGRRA